MMSPGAFHGTRTMGVTGAARTEEAPTILKDQVPALGRYEARAIVTGTDRRDRPKGFAQCLADVLVKHAAPLAPLPIEIAAQRRSTSAASASSSGRWASAQRAMPWRR